MTLHASAVSSTSAYNIFFGTDAGTSDVASRLHRKFRGVIDDLARSATGEKRLSQPFQLLDDVATRCELPNWDHDGALPVAPQAIREAKALLLALPPSIEIPDIFPDATGAVAFEWYKSRGFRYVVTMSGNGLIEFAGLFGPGNEQYGILKFQGAIPRAMRDHFAYLYS
jgi:hypothetical protein